MKLNRRQTLVGMGTALILPTGCATQSPAKRGYANEVFAHGVASGDPDTDSVVLWTRVSGAAAATEVTWRVALDPDMDQVVATGSFRTGEERDYTVKVVPRGLAAGRTLFPYTTFRSKVTPLQ